VKCYNSDIRETYFLEEYRGQITVRYRYRYSTGTGEPLHVGNYRIRLTGTSARQQLQTTVPVDGKGPYQINRSVA
jgi:hypothetical protein